MQGRQVSCKGSPVTHPAGGAQQIPVADSQHLSHPQQRRKLHLHELKDLPNEHAGEAILLVQVIDVNTMVKENTLESPL